MSLFKYNGVYLPDAMCKFDQEALTYQDTDWYLNRFDISVTCVLHADYMAMVAPDLMNLDGSPVTDNMARVMRVIYSRLMTHRKQLSLTMNGLELIPQRAGVPGYVDAQNGPIPQTCKITQLSTVCFLVEYRIIAHYWENNTVAPFDGDPPPSITNKAGNAVLYNRWSETVDINIQQFTRYTREGTFRIRSDNKQGFIPDELRRQMAVVSPRPGFLRESSSYTQSEDGLSLRYRIVDQEVYKMPPTPAYVAEGYYKEYTTRIEGIKRHGEVQIRLKGRKSFGEPQSVLVRTAIGVALSKLNVLANSGNYILEGMSLNVNLYENEVDFNVRAFYASGLEGNRNKRLMNVLVVGDGDMTAQTFTPGSDGVGGNRKPPVYLPYGSAGVILQAAAYWDPSLAGAQLGVNGNIVGGTGKLPGQAGANP